ncbi:phage tail protein [Campylobacter ureolyticus]|uniref:phage tail protein n=1 Tax=Campylobacter ureolyticus TaxID=827 RepID=UPI0022B409BD|nr:phage tail protein [Campylobacter ureolyticus]MCZ6116585.1 phage tail protein [Campylobacter ureolyticus]
MQYFSLITEYGLNKQIQALSNNQTIKLTKMAVGSGDGEITQSQTTLQEQKYEFFINSIEVDENNKNQLIAIGVIPSDIGGFYIKEVGIFDDSKNLFAIGKIAPTYKPLLSEGSAKDLTIKFYLQVENVNNIELKIDPSVVIATRKWTLNNLNKKADKLDVYTKKETFNQDEINALIPAGTIIQSASQSTPGGYLKCNGASISRVSYQKLFEVIGTTFGSDDSNTFRLPDLRGRFIRGFSDGSSIDGDRAFGSSQDSAVGRHIHLLPTGVGNDKLGDGAIWGVIDNQWVNTKNVINASPKDGVFAFTHNDDGGEYAKNALRKKGLNYFFENFKNESRPYNIALNFYIKY